ncbi:Rnai polymerase [Metarhizium album ARSEF 1941]|uniref:RNA-dependent RNA polymerase n=1 Tax=Metarhizium album (strain ARSEF 1941) TaxID=1081103 RepID=A0A0B2X1J7_METAS|nr:Rnai polymerase [Metarhizium album ARSEF 1941]KHN99724.1 Rnai polymerase [Metarhizium album ARSEF 1941]
MIRKRLENDNSTLSKRAKSDEDTQQAKTYYAIDSIPLRSTVSQPSNRVSVSAPCSTRKNLSGPPRPIGITTSSSASNTSNNTSFSSASGFDSPLYDSSSDYFTSPESPAESETEVAGANIPLQTLKRRLEKVWPKFSYDDYLDFAGAPLAVTWEITRIALECGVELADCKVGYKNSPQWNNRDLLHSTLSRLPEFQNKTMPQLSSREAWNLALHEFQSTQAVNLSAELKLNDSSTGPLFSLKLLPLHLEKSNRLSRRFGADRFLKIVMPYPKDLKKVTGIQDDGLLAYKMAKWLTGNHYFLGRVWTAFYCAPEKHKKNKKQKKQDDQNAQNAPKVSHIKVYLFASGGDSFQGNRNGSLASAEEARTPVTRTPMKIHQLLDWALGGLGKADQQVPKLFSRIALSLTDTTPSVVLENHQIHHADKDIGSHGVMNDGIGRMSKALAAKIAFKLGLTEVPSAFQARLGSAKGMWIADSDPKLGDGDWIVTYPSQRKWDCDDEDSHHRTFEVKEWSREPSSAFLNEQLITVLEAQAINPGRMRELITDYLRSELREALAAQKTAMEDRAELRLWLQQGGGTNPRGLDNRIIFVGGLPQGFENRIALLLDSGFHLRSCKFLQRLFWHVVSHRGKALKDKIRISVPCSVNLLMVVDFSSVLEEGEVHVSFSTKFRAADASFCDTLLEGMDVLVARAPSHLPNDIQRVKVVSKPELRHLKDVIVFSTKGQSSLADKLSGGDYDGDRAWVCWDQNIVQNFRNAPPLSDDTDPDKNGSIKRLDRPMAQLRQEETTAEDVCAKFLRESFCFNMQPSLLGICTTFKDSYAKSTRDISSNQIVTLSRLLGCLVDQPKQGYIFTHSDWARFRKDLKIQLNLQFASKQSKPHISDYLKQVACKTVDDTLAELHRLLESYDAHDYDEHLTNLYKFFSEEYKGNKTWENVKKALAADIESVSKLWSTSCTAVNDRDYDAITGSVYGQWRQIQPLATEMCSDLVRHLLQPYMADRQSTLWELLKASCAFSKSYLYPAKADFVWRMAGRQLALLKSTMSHSDPTTSCALVVPELYSALRPDRKLIAARRARRLAEGEGACHLSAADLEMLQVEHDTDMDEEAGY